MALRLSALAGGGVTIGQAVFLEDTQPSDLTIYGRRYLQSGYVEDDMSLFDADIFTAKSFVNASYETPNITTGNTGKVASSGSIFVAAGGNTGTPEISSSTDGETWTARAVPFSTGKITALRFINGIFIAGSSAAEIAVSSDGISWAVRTNPLSSQQINDFAYGAGLFIGVATGGQLISSPDAVTWTLRTSSFSATNINGVYFANSVFVAVGSSGKIASSTDGIGWTQRSQPAGASVTFNAVAGSDSEFIAVGTLTTGRVIRSLDGVTWLSVTSTTTGGFGGQIYDIEYLNNKFNLVGTLGTLGATSSILTSDDGTSESWEEFTFIDDSDVIFSISSIGNLYIGAFNTVDSIIKVSFSNYAGSTVAHSENGENQYVRIS